VGGLQVTRVPLKEIVEPGLFLFLFLLHPSHLMISSFVPSHSPTRRCCLTTGPEAMGPWTATSKTVTKIHLSSL
jgi:hypothetical protein